MKVEGFILAFFGSLFCIAVFMLLPFNSSRDNSERDLPKYGNGGSTDLVNAGIGAFFQ